MKRALRLLLFVFAVSGCSAVVPKRSPVNGAFITSVKGFDNVTENTVESTTSRICVTGAYIPGFGPVAWGNSAVAAVAGPTSRVSIVDTDMFGVLGLYAQHCSVVHGGTKQGADMPPEAAANFGAAPTAIPSPPPPPPARDGTSTATPPAPSGADPVASAPVPPSGAPVPPSGAAPANDAPPSAAPAWPATVPVAERTTCSFVCMSNGASVESRQVEGVLGKQLGAMRACAVQTGEYRTVSTEVSFGADGRMRFAIDPGGVRSSMQACLRRIPAPGYFHGPANTSWKCTDYCR